MGFRRDGISSNVEISGELDEIFEKRGDGPRLEDLKQLLHQPIRQRELLQSWLHTQDLWLQKIPLLLKKLHEDGKDTEQLIGLLQSLDTLHEEDLDHLLIFIDLESEQQLAQSLLKDLRQTLVHYQQLRAQIAQELPESDSQIARILVANPLAQRIEDSGEAQEITDPLDA